MSYHSLLIFDEYFEHKNSFSGKRGAFSNYEKKLCGTFRYYILPFLKNVKAYPNGKIYIIFSTELGNDMPIRPWSYTTEYFSVLYCDENFYRNINITCQFWLLKCHKLQCLIFSEEQFWWFMAFSLSQDLPKKFQ